MKLPAINLIFFKVIAMNVKKNIFKKGKMSDINYCSILSKEAEEPLAGTAPFARHFIFITWPKKFWQYEALDSKGGFPEGLKNWMKINSEINGKISIRLVSTPGLSYDKVQIFIYPGKYQYTNILPNEINAVLESYFQNGVSEAFSPTKIIDDQIFVCTHGRHDKCCAKFGKELVDELRYHILNKKMPIQIWDSSHLGGHRFAATCIDFPAGHAYGRISRGEVPNFLAKRKTNQIYGAAYRGSVFLSGIEQVAEAHAKRFAFLKNWDCNHKIMKLERLSEKTFTCLIYFGSNDNSFNSEKSINDKMIFNFRLKSFKNPSGCDDLENQKIRSVWDIESTEYF